MRQAILDLLQRPGAPWLDAVQVAAALTREHRTPVSPGVAAMVLTELAEEGLVEAETRGDRPHWRAGAHCSLADAARRLGVSSRTLRRDISAGRLAAVRVRGRIRIPLAALEASYPAGPRAPEPSGGEAVPVRPTGVGARRRAPAERVLARVRRSRDRRG